MVLPANALTTLATVFDELDGDVATDNGGPIDTRLERYIKAASALFRRECGRDFEFQAAIVEKAAGYGFTNVYARRSPIVALAQVKVDDAVLSSTAYELRDAGTERSKVFRSTGWTWSAGTRNEPTTPPVPGTERRYIELTYDGGYVTPQQVVLNNALVRTLPDDIEDAVVSLVVSRWRRRGVDLRERQQSGQSSGVTFLGDPVAPEIVSVMQGYAHIVHG